MDPFLLRTPIGTITLGKSGFLDPETCSDTGTLKKSMCKKWKFVMVQYQATNLVQYSIGLAGLGLVGIECVELSPAFSAFSSCSKTALHGVQTRSSRFSR